MYPTESNFSENVGGTTTDATVARDAAERSHGARPPLAESGEEPRPHPVAARVTHQLSHGHRLLSVHALGEAHRYTSLLW